MILGNRSLISQIQESISSGRLFHAYIISGLSGFGKKTLATYLSMAAVCTATGASGKTPPCGECNPCRKAKNGIHPDIERIRPVKRTVIDVETIRSLTKSLHIRPNEAPKRVAIIEKAGSMTHYAQNSLLKYLEDPPAPVLLILITEDEADLLPTIVSRSNVLRMLPLPVDLVAEEVLRRKPKISKQTAKQVARRSGGSLGAALEYAEGLEGEEGRSDEDIHVKRIAAALASGSDYELVETINRLGSLERSALVPVLNGLRLAFRDGLFIKYGENGDIYPEEGEILANIFKADALMRMENGCTVYLDYLSSNVSAAHISGALLSLFTEEKHR